jgi:hypothetical protein
MIVRIAADAAGAERERGALQMAERDAVDGDVGRLASQMLAVHRGPQALAPQQLVGRSGAITGEQAEGLLRLDAPRQALQQVEEMGVDRRHGVG